MDDVLPARIKENNKAKSILDRYFFVYSLYNLFNISIFPIYKSFPIRMFIKTNKPKMLLLLNLLIQSFGLSTSNERT